MGRAQQELDEPFSAAVAHKTVQQLEADLLGQGLSLFPATKAGIQAQRLWKKVKLDIGRGLAIEVTVSALGLDWHRQELKRARDILVEMGLIWQRADGRYVLGQYDQLDELVRDKFLDLKLLEEVAVSLGRLMHKSKTQKRS